MAIITAQVKVAPAGPAPTSQPDRLSLDDVLDGIRARAARMQRAQCRVVSDLYLSADVSPSDWIHRTTNTYQVVRDGSKVGFSVDTNYFFRADGPLPARRVMHNAWNGTIFTGYEEHPEHPDIKLQGSRVARLPPMFRSDYVWATWEQYALEFSDSLSALTTSMQWTAEGMEMIDGRPVWKIHSAAGPATNRKVIEVWLDAVRDFAPVRMRCYAPAMGRDKLSAEMTNVRLEEHAGVWLISAATILVHNSLADTKYPLNRYEIKITDWKVGMPIPADAFEIKFPKGCVVWDDIAKNTYSAGEWVLNREPDGRYTKVPLAGDSIGATNGEFAATSQPALPSSEPPDVPPVQVAQGSSALSGRTEVLLCLLGLGVVAAVGMAVYASLQRKGSR
jgi:hypothetical protein